MDKLIGIIVIIFILSMCTSKDKEPSTPALESSNTTYAPPEVTEKEKALANFEIKKWSWGKGGFDNVMLITITFVNKGDRGVKDVELLCEHSAKSGTEIDSNRKTIYEVFPAGKTKTIREFNMGFIHSQANSSNCRVTDLVVM